MNRAVQAISRNGPATFVQSQSLIPSVTESRAVWGVYTEMPAAAQRRREAWSGLLSVMDVSGLKIGGWYETMSDVGVVKASSTTAGVRLIVACSSFPLRSRATKRAHGYAIRTQWSAISGSRSAAREVPL